MWRGKCLPDWMGLRFLAARLDSTWFDRALLGFISCIGSLHPESRLLVTLNQTTELCQDLWASCRHQSHTDTTGWKREQRLDEEFIHMSESVGWGFSVANQCVISACLSHRFEANDGYLKALRSNMSPSYFIKGWSIFFWWSVWENLTTMTLLNFQENGEDFLGQKLYCIAFNHTVPTKHDGDKCTIEL